MTREHLWAPWRIEYVRGPKDEGCIFCAALEHGRDREDLVLARGDTAFVMLNRYPYAAGHLMVVPNRHLSDFGALDESEAAEVWRWLRRAKAALDDVFRPHGYNVGLNQGSAAGAGFADHLHLHLVPRWVGDTNFMPMLGDVQVMSQHLAAMYDDLAPHFALSGGA